MSGPPCAGKTTYVDQHRGPEDVVIDFDRIAHALGYPTEHVAWPADAHPARMVALRARASALRAVMDHRGDYTAWIVTSAPGVAPSGLQPDESHVIDPGRDECWRRVDLRATNEVDANATRREIDAWYEQHAPVDADTPSRSW